MDGFFSNQLCPSDRNTEKPIFQRENTGLYHVFIVLLRSSFLRVKNLHFDLNLRFCVMRKVNGEGVMRIPLMTMKIVLKPQK